MSGLKNTVKRIHNLARGEGYATGDELRAKDKAERQAARDKLYTGARMPDPEELKRNARRKAAKRPGSRADTILTERDTLG